MSDTNALFSAAHNNLETSGAAISVTTLGSAREAMRLQTGLDGTTLLNLQPNILLVPASAETAAQQFIASITATKGADVNPFASSMQIVVEPRLDAHPTDPLAWYVISTQTDTVECATLEGQEGPNIESREGFDVDGVEWRARIDFACKALDWRGMYKNDGVS